MSTIIQEAYLGNFGDTLRKPFLERTNYENINTGMKVISKVYPIIVLPNFLKEEFYKELEGELESSVNYEERKTDLYRFHQTGDLKTHNSSTITKLWKGLASMNFVTQVEIITNRPLCKTHIDFSSQRYDQYDYLLDHDDRLDSRRVAFVLYLVEEDWGVEDGGELQFIPTDWRGTPTTNHIDFQNFIPKRNTLILFEVSRASHHQVAQVNSSKRGPRRSIAGWLHDSSPNLKFLKLLNTPNFISPSPRRIVKESGVTIRLEQVFNQVLLDELEEYNTISHDRLTRLVTTQEAFHFFQEKAEPLWMRLLMGQSFIQWLQGQFSSSTNFDWPTRPVLKMYKPGDYRKSRPSNSSGGSDGMEELEKDKINVFIFPRDDYILLTRKDVSINLYSTPKVLIEIQFNTIITSFTMDEENLNSKKRSLEKCLGE